VLEAINYMVWLEEHVYPLGNGQGLPHPVKVSEPCMHARAHTHLCSYISSACLLCNICAYKFRYCIDGVHLTVVANCNIAQVDLIFKVLLKRMASVSIYKF